MFEDGRWGREEKSGITYNVDVHGTKRMGNIGVSNSTVLGTMYLCYFYTSVILKCLLKHTDKSAQLNVITKYACFLKF